MDHLTIFFSQWLNQRWGEITFMIKRHSKNWWSRYHDVLNFWCESTTRSSMDIQYELRWGQAFWDVQFNYETYFMPKSRNLQRKLDVRPEWDKTTVWMFWLPPETCCPFEPDPACFQGEMVFWALRQQQRRRRWGEVTAPGGGTGL